MQPRLAILILTYNEEKNIGSCMDSAAFADEIIVIDSGSTDQTAALAAEKYPPHRGTAVNDFAGVIDATNAAKMESLAREILQKTGMSVVVATVAPV